MFLLPRPLSHFIFSLSSGWQNQAATAHAVAA
jgi:hypothetical protein